MKITISTYWKCQLIGWTIWTLINYFVNVSTTPGGSGFATLAIIGALFGIGTSHLFRWIVKRFRIMDKKLAFQIIYLPVIIVVLIFLANLFMVWVFGIAGLLGTTRSPNSGKFSFFRYAMMIYYQGVVIGIGWAAIYFFVHYLRQLKKTEQEKAALRIKLVESEVQALRVQMNPHFISNSMNTVKSLIKKNENERAASYLTTLSKLIRILFQNSDKQKVSLFEELETCQLYAQLEKIRFDNKIDVSFEIDETVDLKDIKVPMLALQPLVENAVWHGLMPKESGGKIVITVKENDGAVQCSIDDDGIGREMSRKYKLRYDESRQARGLTQSRLEPDKVLNEREEDIFIIDKESEDGSPGGTKVIIRFKENRN